MPFDPFTRPLAAVDEKLRAAATRRHDLLAERNVKQDALVATLHQLDGIDRCLASVGHEIDSLIAERQRAIANQQHT